MFSISGHIILKSIAFFSKRLNGIILFQFWSDFSYRGRSAFEIVRIRHAFHAAFLRLPSENHLFHEEIPMPVHGVGMFFPSQTERSVELGDRITLLAQLI